jgi:hypothetical protein
LGVVAALVLPMLLELLAEQIPAVAEVVVLVKVAL